MVVRSVISGIGIDICSISRMERAAKSDHFVQKIFSADEIEHAQKKARPAASFAAAFAAREAFSKASGISMFDTVFNQGVSVVRGADGRPALEISPEIRKKIDKNFNDFRVFLSLSHDGDFAVAFVILEQNKKAGVP